MRFHMPSMRAERPGRGFCPEVQAKAGTPLIEICTRPTPAAPTRLPPRLRTGRSKGSREKALKKLARASCPLPEEQGLSPGLSREQQSTCSAHSGSALEKSSCFPCSLPPRLFPEATGDFIRRASAYSYGCQAAFLNEILKLQLLCLLAASGTLPSLPLLTELWAEL